MKISPEKKKQMILDSFELLKNDYDENRVALWNAVGKMAKIDTEIAVTMWKYLIKDNPDALHTSDDFSFSVMYSIEKAIGKDKTYRLVASDDFLKESIYKESGELECCPLYAIGFFIETNELTTANELLELIVSNSYAKVSLYHVLDQIIPDDPDEDERISDEAYNLLNGWIEKVSNKKERAKLNLKMLAFLEDEPE